MILIEPCCAPKHLLALRSRLGTDGTAFFHGYGDLSLAELLPAMLTRYSEVELMFVAPFIPDAAARVLKRMMEKRWPSADGKDSLYSIGHLTLVADLCRKKSPAASSWTPDRFGGRITPCSTQQNDTAIILPDIALYGAFNLTYGGHFSGIATKNARTIQSLRSMYSGMQHR